MKQLNETKKPPNGEEKLVEQKQSSSLKTENKTLKLEKRNTN